MVRVVVAMIIMTGGGGEGGGEGGGNCGHSGHDSCFGSSNKHLSCLF